MLGAEVEVLVSAGEGRKDARDRAGVRAGARRPARACAPSAAERRRAGDIVTALVTYAAPHHLVADGGHHRASTLAGRGRQCRTCAAAAAEHRSTADRLTARPSSDPPAKPRPANQTSSARQQRPPLGDLVLGLRDRARRRRTCGRVPAWPRPRPGARAGRSGTGSTPCCRGATGRRRPRGPAARRPASGRRCAASRPGARGRSSSKRACRSRSAAWAALGSDEVDAPRPGRSGLPWPSGCRFCSASRSANTPERRAKKPSCAARNRAHSASSTSRAARGARLPLRPSGPAGPPPCPSSHWIRPVPRPA